MTFLVAGLAIAALAAVALSACGGGDNATQSSGVIAAINVLDNAGLHEIDTSITADGQIPATAHTTAVHLQTVLLTTAWPGELKDPAKKLAGLLGDFASAIDTDKPDMAKVTDASNKVHAGEHDFSHQVWDYLGKKAGLAMGADEDHAEASSASPTAAAAKLQVTGVTARPTTNDVSAIYFTVKNSGAADRLVSAAVDASVATMVQLHTMVTTGGTTQMQQVTGIDVPANGEVTLKPGGYHVMLMNVQKPLKEGDSIAVTLTFEKAGAVKVTASVHEISGGMGN